MADEREGGQSGRRLWLRLGLQGAFTLAFAIFAALAIDWGELRESITGIDLRWVLPALLVFTFGKYIDSWRWRYLLMGVRDAPPQRSLFGAFLIGNFVNNVLPLRAGDFAKIQVLARRHGTSRASLASSVFLAEATLDGVVFILFLVPVFAFADLGELPQVGRGLILGLGLAAGVAFVAASILGRRAVTLVQWLPLPDSWCERAERLAEQMSEGLHALGSARRTAGAIMLSLPSWLLEALMFWMFGQAFGLDLGYPTYIAAMIAANLAVAIPFALWNIGPYQALVSGLLIAAGVSGTLALTFAVTVHLMTNVWIDLVGLVAFWVMKVSPREVLFLRERPPRAEQATA